MRWLRRHRAALCALAAVGIAFAGWAALDARFAAKEARYDRAMASIAYEGGRLALRVYYRCEEAPGASGTIAIVCNGRELPLAVTAS